MFLVVADISSVFLNEDNFLMWFFYLQSGESIFFKQF